jgi:hypothetical protein
MSWTFRSLVEGYGSLAENLPSALSTVLRYRETAESKATHLD